MYSVDALLSVAVIEVFLIVQFPPKSATGPISESCTTMFPTVEDSSHRRP